MATPQDEAPTTNLTTPLIDREPSDEQIESQQPAPGWYTPLRLLMLFSLITFIIYLDRGVIASNGVQGDSPGRQGIQTQFKLTGFQNGVLPAAFMVGLLVASIVFSELCKSVNAFQLIGWGLLIWTLASIGCGFAINFWTLMLCRIAMGVGEASIINLTGPFIDDVAPPAQKTLWFAVLYLFPTVGIAAGYIFGGLVGPALGWPAPFFIQAALGVPVVLFTMLAEPVSLHNMLDDAPVTPSKRGPLSTLWRDVKVMMSQPIFVLNLLAYCPVQGAFGAYTYWGPQAARELFNLQGDSVDLTFGVVTILTGIVATIVGGVCLDIVGSSLKNAMLLCAWSTLGSFLMIEAAFFFPSGSASSFPVFMAIFAVGELCSFAGTAPSSAVNVWAVPQRLRPLASGMGTIASHLLGDVPSPPFTGWLHDVLGDWRPTMYILSALLFPSAVLYFAGAYVKGKDFRAEQPPGDGDEEKLSPSGVGDVTPAVSDMENAVLASHAAHHEASTSGAAPKDRLHSAVGNGGMGHGNSVPATHSQHLLPTRDSFDGATIAGLPHSQGGIMRAADATMLSVSPFPGLLQEPILQVSAVHTSSQEHRRQRREREAARLQRHHQAEPSADAGGHASVQERSSAATGGSTRSGATSASVAAPALISPAPGLLPEPAPLVVAAGTGARVPASQPASQASSMQERGAATAEAAGTSGNGAPASKAVSPPASKSQSSQPAARAGASSPDPEPSKAGIAAEAAPGAPPQGGPAASTGRQGAGRAPAQQQAERLPAEAGHSEAEAGQEAAAKAATKSGGRQEARRMLTDPEPSRAGATQLVAAADSSGQQEGDSAPASAASDKADGAQEAAAKMAADVLSKAKGQQEADSGPAHVGHSKGDSSQEAAASDTAAASKPSEEATSDESGMTTPEASETQTAAAVKPGSSKAGSGSVARPPTPPTDAPSTSKPKSKKRKGKKKR